MQRYINQFLDVLQLLIDRAPVLHHFIVEVALIGLLIVGLRQIFKKSS
jgi:hypothetical protein